MCTILTARWSRKSCDEKSDLSSLHSTGVKGIFGFVSEMMISYDIQSLFKSVPFFYTAEFILDQFHAKCHLSQDVITKKCYCHDYRRRSDFHTTLCEYYSQNALMSISCVLLQHGLQKLSTSNDSMSI